MGVSVRWNFDISFADNWYLHQINKYNWYLVPSDLTDSYNMPFIYIDDRYLGIIYKD